MTATLDRPPPAPDGPTWRDRLQPATAGRNPLLGWLAALGVGLLAGILRFVRLDLPAGRIFDEVYYSCDAQNLLRYGVETQILTDPDDDTVIARCEPLPSEDGSFIAHPPLGKWLIALGIRLFGADELGWRFAAALAGTVTVVVLVRMARRMTGSTVLGALAGLLLAFDGLHFVQSRVAMLDVFLVLWTTSAAACLVADRDTVRSRLARADDDALTGWGPRLGPRPWLVAAGLCLGAAVATKWSGLYFVAVLGLLALAWEVGARRTAGVAAPVRATLVRSTAPLAGLLLLLPTVVYVASWAGWFAGDSGWSRQWGEQNPASGALAGLVPDGLRSLWHYHGEIFRFHDDLTDSHPYQSSPASWLVLARPVSYYYPQDVGPGDYGCAAPSCAREVLAIGTPALWWVAVAALLLLTWKWAAHRDWRAGAVVLLALTPIVPWIRDDLDGRTMFLFYALPAVPFLALAVALVAGWAVGDGRARTRRRVATAVAGSHLALVVANFAWLYPVLAAQTIPYAAWYARMWFPSWI